MKRLIFLALAFLLFVSGCAKQPENPQVATEEATLEATIPETEPETESVPETLTAIALANNIPIRLAVFNRGDVVDVTGSLNEDKVIVKLPEGYAVVNGSLLVSVDAGEYAEWTGYSTWNAKMYDNYRLLGTPIVELRSKSVQVVDELSNCYIVVLDEQLGYVAKKGVSRWRSSGGGGDNNDGSGNGGSSGSSGGGNSGVDGGDISLYEPYFVTKLSTISQTGIVSGKATVKADGVEAVLGFLQAGEKIDVVLEKGFAPNVEGYYTVLIDGLYAYVRSDLLAMPGDEIYVSWDGFTKSACEINDGLYLDETIVMKPALNTVVTVLQEFRDCYYVSINDCCGFVAKESISTTKTPTYSGGGNDSGGSSGENSSSGSGSESGGDAWSPPML